MRYLLDTNVVSELGKHEPRRIDPNVLVWAASIDAHELFLSVITMWELEVGVLRAERRNLERGRHLRAWFDTRLLPEFTTRVLAIDAATAQRCSALHVPTTRPLADSLIGATALVHGMTVVTRNEADFAPMGVRLLNPWQRDAIRSGSAP